MLTLHFHATKFRILVIAHTTLCKFASRVGITQIISCVFRAYEDDSSGYNEGCAAYIFELNQYTMICGRVVKLLPSVGVDSDRFGFSASIAIDHMHIYDLSIVGIFGQCTHFSTGVHIINEIIIMILQILGMKQQY